MICRKRRQRRIIGSRKCKDGSDGKAGENSWAPIHNTPNFGAAKVESDVFESREMYGSRSSGILGELGKCIANIKAADDVGV